MGDGASLTVQIHHHGAWHDAADLAITDVQAGSRSPTRLDYDPFYFIAFGNAELAAGRPVTDWRAVSVHDRVDMAAHRRDHWPPFLLDLLPQGHARRRLADEMGFGPDDEGFALPETARIHGVPEPVIARAFAACGELAVALASLPFSGTGFGDGDAAP